MQECSIIYFRGPANREVGGGGNVGTGIKKREHIKKEIEIERNSPKKRWGGGGVATEI